MKTKRNCIRDLPAPSHFTKGDTLVVFGEVFERGYVNGIIDEAKNVGMKIIYSTVGRRDEAQQLRPLTADELKEKDQSPLINIPLEAGFDMEPDSSGIRPVDQLKDYGLTGWETARLNWTSIEESRQKGAERFRTHVKKFLSEVEKQIDPQKNLIFVHTMAGGFPRAKVVMPIANRIFKGIGPRYCSSQTFWESEIGRLCDMSFREVTGETFFHLIELSAPLRQKIEKSGGKVRYAAYGYHGNDVLVGDRYEWYSYSPYLQGFAKLRLEAISDTAFEKNVSCTVFNVPEILTNSSSIFLGIEVVLYPLMQALQKEAPQKTPPLIKDLLANCHSRLKEGFTLEDINRVTHEYLTNPEVRSWPSLEGWPQHNGPRQMELMRNSSSAIIDMHKDAKDLMTKDLSEIVFRSCGKIMLREMENPRYGVAWIGHDAVAKAAFN